MGFFLQTFVYCTMSMVYQDSVAVKNFLETNENKPIKMLVYNLKSAKFRNVDLIPSRQWGGTGPAWRGHSVSLLWEWVV